MRAARSVASLDGTLTVHGRQPRANAPSHGPRGVLCPGGRVGSPGNAAISPNCIIDNDQYRKKSGLLTTGPRHPRPNTGEDRVRCGASHSGLVETKCFEPPDQHARAPSVNWFPLGEVKMEFTPKPAAARRPRNSSVSVLFLRVLRFRHFLVGSLAPGNVGFLLCSCFRVLVFLARFVYSPPRSHFSK